MNEKLKKQTNKQTKTKQKQKQKNKKKNRYGTHVAMTKYTFMFQQV